MVGKRYREDLAERTQQNDPPRPRSVQQASYKATASLDNDAHGRKSPR